MTNAALTYAVTHLRRMPGSVLLVDDHPSTLRMYSRILEPLGLYTITADSAGEALMLTGESIWDVAIVDYMMPAMNGVELIEKLGQRVAVWIMVTAYDSDNLRRLSGRHDCLQVIVKPVKPQVLVEAVQRALAIADLKAQYRSS